MDGIVSGFEEKLNKDGPIPDVPNAIQARTQEIQVGGTITSAPYSLYSEILLTRTIAYTALD